MEGGDFATSEGVHAIAFNENTAYITNQTVGTISVVNISTHTVSSNISLGSKPNGNV
jgi:YVTN family beta-propeller protein